MRPIPLDANRHSFQEERIEPAAIQTSAAQVSR